MSIVEKTTKELEAKYADANHKHCEEIGCGFSCATCMYSVVGNDYYTQEDPDRAFCTF